LAQKNYQEIIRRELMVVSLSLPVTGNVMLQRVNNQLQINSVAVVDLSDLVAKIDSVVDAIHLPTIIVLWLVVIIWWRGFR